MPRLSVIKGADQGKLFELTADPLTVGRDSTNRIRLLDTEISRRHAEFARSPDGYRVRDLGSVNGTFVNGQSIRDVLLRPGDQVQVGQTVLLFSAAASQRSAPSIAIDFNPEWVPARPTPVGRAMNICSNDPSSSICARHDACGGQKPRFVLDHTGTIGRCGRSSTCSSVPSSPA